MAIEQGRIKFRNPNKSMKIDGHPFPTNALDINNQEAEGKAKVLTSSHTKKSGVVDPKAQISANEMKDQVQYEKGLVLEDRTVLSHPACC